MPNELEELKGDLKGEEEILEAILEEKEEVENRINEMEEQDDEWTDLYEETLDTDGDVTIGNLSYSPSEVLKQVDSIAYREGYNNWIDEYISEATQELENIEDDIKKQKKEIEELKEKIKEAEKKEKE